MNGSCPGCHGSVDSGDRYCRHCSYPLRGDVPCPLRPGSRAMRYWVHVTILSWVVLLVGASIIGLGAVESVLLTGPLLGGLAVALIVLDFRGKIGVIWLAIAHLMVVCFLWALVPLFELSPGQAARPFLFFGVLWTAVSGLWSLLLIRWRRLPVMDNPWSCQACGYPMVGTDARACPECGAAFSPPTDAAASQAGASANR